jgi:predicted nucleotidyltransferase
MIKDLEKIDVKKRNKVVQGLKLVQDVNAIEPVIDKVIIFGSCVSGKCRNLSDIDICFVSKFDCHNKNYFKVYSEFEIASENLCDIFNYSRVKGSLKDEIDKKGVIVYEY